MLKCQYAGMLPRKNRLKKKKEFEKVFKKGEKFKESFLFLRLLENNFGDSRFGFIVSRRVSKKAVARNKLKRMLREIVRLKLPEIGKKVDGILSVSSAPKKDDFLEMSRVIDKLFKKAGIVK